MSIENSPVILVVDDSPDTVSMLNDALDSAGYTVLVALSGTQALSVIRKITPDLILMDVMMPGKDGFATCQELKSDPLLRDVPLIFMTGRDSEEVMSSSFDFGAVDYIQKPIRLEELTRRIRQHIERARALHDSRHMLDDNGIISCIADASGKIAWCTPKFYERLASCGYSRLSLLSDFQPLLRKWLEKARVKDQLSLKKENPRVDLLLEEKLDSGEYRVRLIEKDSTDVYKKLMDEFGLTLRESEVLYWVAQGKSNKELALILSISPRTVNKHLETVFEKMMVENRTSAASMALKVMK